MDREAVQGDGLARRRGPLRRTHSPGAGERCDIEMFFFALCCSVPNATATQLRGDFGQVRAGFGKVKEAVMT